MTSATLELGLSRPGRGELYVGGERLTDAQRRLGISSEGKIAIGLAAVAVVAAVVLLSHSDDDDERCLLPEGCTN